MVIVVMVGGRGGGIVTSLHRYLMSSGIVVIVTVAVVTGILLLLYLPPVLCCRSHPLRSPSTRYLKMEKETAETIMEGGWVRSGDVATVEYDDDPVTEKSLGFCRITGRIKEIIITAGGENM